MTSTETRKGGPQKGQVYKKRRPYEVIICPHCLTEGKGSVMARWHFERCKDTPVEAESDV